MSTKLYPYQKEAVQQIEDFDGRSLLAMEMGTGKSLCVLDYLKKHPEKRPAIIVCPASLKWVWEDQAHRHRGLRTTIINGRKKTRSALHKQNNLIVINYDILDSWKEYLKGLNPQVIIGDECFIYETPILTNKGWLSIGSIVENKIKVSIASYNFTTNNVEFHPITHYFKNKRHSKLVEIKWVDGSFICTENHKIWIEGEGYVSAKEIHVGSYMSLVQKTLLDEKSGENNKKMLFDTLCSTRTRLKTRCKTKNIACSKKETCNKKMSMVWGTIRDRTKQRKKILREIVFCKMENEAARNNCHNEKSKERNEYNKSITELEKNRKRATSSGRSIRKNEKEKSNVYEWCCRKDVKNKGKQRDTSCVEGKARRKWTIYTRAIAPTKSFGIEMEIGIADPHTSKTTLSNSIQSRYRKKKIQNCHRSRRSLPQKQKKCTERQKERHTTHSVRVESIKVYKRRSDERSVRYIKNNSFVYNIEVKDNHNYFANGVLVSNCHFVKSTKTKRTKAMRFLCKDVPHVIMLSGTPLTNRPAELFPTLNILYPKEFPHFFTYAQRYTAPRLMRWGWDFRGASHLDELHARLKRLGMVRKLKKDVLKDLPAKTRIVVPMDIEHRKEYDRAITDFIAWLGEKSPAEAKRARKAEELVKLGHTIRLAAELKMKSVFEWVDNYFEESDGKLVLFCCHKKIVRMIKERYPDISVVITGATSKNNRRAAVENFQKNKRIRLFIGNIKAAGVGIDLWAANTMAFVETGFVPGDVIQAEDRLHRIGQKKQVFCYYLIAKNTIESDLCRVLQEKQKIITKTLDGATNRGDTRLDVYSQLMKTLRKGE